MEAPSEGRFALQNSALTPIHKENPEGGGAVNSTGKMEDDLQRRLCLRKLSLGLTGPAGTDKQKRIEKNAKSEEKRDTKEAKWMN